MEYIKQKEMAARCGKTPAYICQLVARGRLDFKEIYGVKVVALSKRNLKLLKLVQ
jgi:hypothetical protein